MTIKEFAEMKMIGSDSSPRGKFCARLLNDLLLRLVGQLGKIPDAAYLALQWEDGTKVLIAAKDSQAAANVQAGVLQEIQASFELGKAKLAEKEKQ
jgi:hypothetical protein